MAATDTDGRTAEEPKAQDAAQGGSAKGGGSEPAKGDGAAQNPSPAADGEGLKDRHGQDAISAGKYERDMAERDERIKSLEAQLDEKAKTEKGRADLKAEIERMRADMAEQAVTHKLEMAGCRNVKAAKAVLADCGGDVAKLREEAPYLFEDAKKKGSTGKQPAGAADALDDKLDRAFRLK